MVVCTAAATVGSLVILSLGTLARGQFEAAGSLLVEQNADIIRIEILAFLAIQLRAYCL